MKRFQEFLIKKGYDLGLAGADGIAGKKTRAAAENYARMTFYTLKYVWDESKDSIVALRMDDSFTDKFSDFCLIISKGKCVQVIEWTTKPGKYYVSNPVTVGGVTGTGCMKEGQYRSSHKYHSKPKSKWGKAGWFEQVKSITVYRDGNKDNTLDKNITQVAPTWYGFFLHAMGKGFSIWNWSAGCNGAPLITWQNYVDPYFKDGSIIDFTIIDAK